MTTVTTGSGGATTVTTGSGGSTSSASGTGGSGGSGGGVTAGVGGGLLGECVSPTTVLDPFGNDTGFLKCADGTVHRAKIVDCDLTAGAPACSGNEDEIQCATDADCGLHPHGRCAHYPNYGGPGAPQTICGCTYPCGGDADCNAGEVCVCAGVVTNTFHPWATCSTAQCASDADCASGECGVVFFNSGCGYGAPVLACRSAADGCRTTIHCLPDVPHCTVNPALGNTWQCIEGAPCGIGRPLMVEGRARTASATARSDWGAGDLGVSAHAIDAELRDALARHWLAVAALEHASVASFARFTLHLLALGAPPSLVARRSASGPRRDRSRALSPTGWPRSTQASTSAPPRWI